MLQRLILKLRAPVLLLLVAVAVNIHVLALNQTTMPPHSIAFGADRILDPSLVTQQPLGRPPRMLAGYYTADPVGTLALYPFDRFALNTLVKGEIPFWNPYTLTGIPFLAEYQWGVFYPPNWLRLLIPERWWDLYSALHVFLLALVVYSIARGIYGGFQSAIYAGSAVFGIGFILLYFPTHTVIVVAPWGAMVILGLERLVKREWDFAGLAYSAAGVYGLATSGHPTPAIFWFVTLMFYLPTRWWLDRNTGKALIPFVTIFVVATSAAAINLIPFFVYVLTDGGNTIALFDSPMFFSFRDLLMFMFPYVFGPMYSFQPPELFSRGYAPGPLLVGSFMMFPVFVGGWFAITRRQTQLVSWIISGLVIALWAFGILPISLLSKLPFLVRLNFHYAWIIPSVTLCLLAGYGYKLIIHQPVHELRKPFFLYVGFYLLATLALFGYLWHSDLTKEFFSTTSLLLQGLLPSLAFAVLSPTLILLLLHWVDHRFATNMRGRLLSQILVVGFALNVLALYPTANPSGVINIPLFSFALFIVVSLLFVALANSLNARLLSYTTNPVTTMVVLGGIIAIANLVYPGLPERYDIVGIPEFVERLSYDRLNWRSYGLNGAVPYNNLVRYDISAVNNQNALVPGALRSFIHNYLDSEQIPTLFFGFQYTPEVDPLSQYIQNIRFWEYIGVRHIVIFAGSPNQNLQLLKELGYETTSSNESEVVIVPHLSEKDTLLSLSRQVDCSEGAFSTIRIRLGTFLRVNPGRVVLSATDLDGKILAQASMDSSQIRDAYFHLFTFDHEVCTDSSLKINLSIWHEGGIPGFEVATWRSGDLAVDILRIFSSPKSVRFQRVYSDDKAGIEIFEDPKALPRAYFTTQFSLAPDWQTAQKLFAQQEDLRHTAYGEEQNTVCKSTPIDEPDQSEIVSHVTITELSSNSITIKAEVPAAGTLVLVDTFMPGWNAKVDGKSKPVLRINGVFRGVCIDNAGIYNITMQYQPPYWGLTLLLAAIGFMCVTVILLGAWNKSRYRTQ